MLLTKSRTQEARPAPPDGGREVLTVAHRGASGRAPENTLTALAAAVADGADLLEFDVRRTRDGALVLMHDPTLTRTTDARRVFPDRAPWLVSDFTLAELRRLHAGGTRGEGLAGETVPTLDEALGMARAARVGALVELKPGSDGRLPVVELVAALQGRAHRTVTVQSFDVAGLRHVRALMPSVRIAVLGSPGRADLRALSQWADQVHPHHRRVDRRLVEEAHGWGMRCMVWTVNRPARMRHCLSLGVDGVITDHPALLRDLAPA